MSQPLDARVLYDKPCGGTTLFLSTVASIEAAEAGMKSAVDEAHQYGGTNLRVEMRDRAGNVVYTARVREDAPC